jgi:hypothetical protein
MEASVVKRYEGIPGLLRESPEGLLVLHSDYSALKAALREALGGWETDADRDYKFDKRISELRAQFLDDK